MTGAESRKPKEQQGDSEIRQIGSSVELGHENARCDRKQPYRDRNKHRSISEAPLGHLEAWLVSAWLSLLTTLRRAGVCVVEQRHARKRERWDAGGRRWRGIGEPLASTTDKNRYYEFTAAPRLRGIATITSSVVARVVGARTPVASPAVATVVVVAVEFSCIICDRLRSFSSFWPPPSRCAFYSPSSYRTANQKREINREVDTPDIQGVSTGDCFTGNLLDI